jgi:hypothetical protein
VDRGATPFNAGRPCDAGDCRQVASNRRHCRPDQQHDAGRRPYRSAAAGIATAFGSRIYASARFKTAKPDPRCFRLCLSELDVKPESVLFVDDLMANVAGAREAGLFAHHHTSVEAFKQALSEHGLLHA